MAACVGERPMDQQSPIDIAGYTTDGVPTLSFAYSGSADHLANTGEFVKVNYEDGGGIQLDGSTYQLAEAHTHNPSEHTIDGERFVLEMHLVHRQESGEIAVVGILFRAGEPNAAIQAMIDAALSQGGTARPDSGLEASGLVALRSWLLLLHRLPDNTSVHGRGPLAGDVGSSGGVRGAGDAACCADRRWN